MSAARSTTDRTATFVAVLSLCARCGLRFANIDGCPQCATDRYVQRVEHYA